MRFVAGAGLLVVGLLVATWAVTVFALLTRSPDSGWVNGVEYAGPFFLGGSLAIAAGARLLRAKGRPDSLRLMHHPMRRTAIQLLAVGVLLLAMTVLLLVTTPEEDGANIGAGLVGCIGVGCCLASLFLCLWQGRPAVSPGRRYPAIGSSP